MSQLLTIFNKLTPDTLFDYYQALYWYASLNHEGQFSELYSILSTLQYKPSLTEKVEDVDFDGLGFPVLHDNMLLLAIALRLWSVLQDENTEDRKFAKLHWFAGKNLYLAEYHDFDDDPAEYDTYYMVYDITEGSIINETFPPD
jgi:hypothetical protein